MGLTAVTSQSIKFLDSLLYSKYICFVSSNYMRPSFHHFELVSRRLTLLQLVFTSLISGHSVTLLVLQEWTKRIEVYRYFFWEKTLVNIIIR